MKLIIFTQEQKNSIISEYKTVERTDYFEPIEVFRSKYLSGYPVPFTEVKEYGLTLDCLESPELINFRGFLKCFPIYDADYHIKQKSLFDDTEIIIYL